MTLSQQLDNILDTAKQQQRQSHTQPLGSTKRDGQLITVTYIAPRNVEASNQMVKDLLNNCKSLKPLPKPSLQIGIIAEAPNLYRVSPDDYEQMSTALVVIESVVLKPIELNTLNARINSFASQFHFAFGDKNDRQVAIGNWVAKLSQFPEWAITQALEDIESGFEKGILTIGMVIKRIQYYLGDAYAKRDKIKHIFRNGQVFKTHAEYAEWKEAQHQAIMKAKAERETQEAQNAKTAQALRDLKQDNQEYYEAQKTERLTEIKDQSESIANTMRKYKTNARLIELYEEFEQLKAELEEGENAQKD